MILGRDILTKLGLNLNFSEPVIETGDVLFFQVSTAPMADLGVYVFKGLNTGKVTTRESFTNAYVE